MDSPCREWQGAIDDNGYGVRGVDSKKKYLHRWVVEQVDGPIPEGMDVMHLCHNRKCFRYDHLKVGTRSENLRMSPSTVGKGNAILTEEQVLEIYGSTEPAVEAASKYGVTKWTIYNVRNGRDWSWLTNHPRRSAGV